MSRKIIIVVTACVIFAVVAPLTVSAAVPSGSSQLATGLYLVNSTTWKDPDNTAVVGDTNTYYQWMFTCIPAYSNLTFSPPNFTYTYDGSFLAGSSPDFVYQLKISTEYMSMYGGQVLKYQLFKVDAEGDQSLLGASAFYPGIQYQDLVTFCGWGIDPSNGKMCMLLDIDGSLFVYSHVVANGDTHLYAKPNNFDGLYMLGCMTIQYENKTDIGVKSAYQQLEDAAKDTSTYKDWLSYLYTGIPPGSTPENPDPEVEHTIDDIYNLMTTSRWNDVTGDPAPELSIDQPDYTGTDFADLVLEDLFDDVNNYMAGLYDQLTEGRFEPSGGSWGQAFLFPFIICGIIASSLIGFDLIMLLVAFFYLFGYFINKSVRLGGESIARSAGRSAKGAGRQIKNEIIYRSSRGNNSKNGGDSS